MLATRLVKNLMWLLRYPSFAPVSGVYRVGAIQTRFPNSIGCQIDYPADQPTKKTVFTPYWRPQAIDGLADYSRTPSSILDFLTYRQHPCLINAEPLSSATKFPIILFSHGLGGSMEMYTQLCQQMASQGFIVVAMEHEEGSGAYAETAQGEPILYTRPDDSPYSRQKVLDFRCPFLQQRVQETNQVMDILLGSTAGTPTNTLLSPMVQKILQIGDTSKGIAFVGHSFGGASLVLTTQESLASGNNKKRMIPNSLCLLDPWCFCLPDAALDQGMPSSIPTLSILSENWLTNPERFQVHHLLQNCETVSSWYIPRSAHASFSDAVSWLPRWMGKRLGLCSKKERKHKTIPTAAKACVEHIQSVLSATTTTANNQPQSPPQASEFLQHYAFEPNQEPMM